MRSLGAFCARPVVWLPAVLGCVALPMVGQQVSCPSGTTTSISGTVFAPNGTDPLPNIVVYVPTTTVEAFTPGVSCPAVGTPPSGTPLVGTTSGEDGTFKLDNVPAGTNIPLVIVSGRWRRQFVVPATTACADTSFPVRMPRNQSEGDIPKFALATGNADQVECVLRKVGLDDAEFTNPGGGGRIEVYKGSGSAGAQIDASTPSETTLMGTASTLNAYDVLMLPCEGGQYLRTANQLANFVAYANAGGRVYSSHYSYVWMFANPPFDTVAKWTVNLGTYPDGIATVDPTFPGGQTLSDWLQLVGASTTPGQIAISTLKHDLAGVNSPTQSWLNLNSNGAVMQFTFDAPVGATAGTQCGRVLFNEYHVENPLTSPSGKKFPAECPAGAMTPQEKLLEYSLFNLSGEGGGPTMTPLTQEFGSEALGFNSAQQTFTWKNNSVFPLAVSSVKTTGDFAVSSNGCGTVVAGGTCTIGVVFNPTVLGARTGTLVVASSAKTLTATLTGTGTPDLVSATTALDFGSSDLGVAVTKTMVVTNSAPGPLTLATPTTTGDFSAVSGCTGTIPAGGSCTLTAAFTPTITGTRTGTLTVAANSATYSSVSASLTGNGQDFSLTMNSSSGSVIAGYSASTSVTLTPIAGFARTVGMTCTTNAPASTCTLSPSTVGVSSATTSQVAITTTSKYTVIGYGGCGRGMLTLFVVGSGALLWMQRRRAGTLPGTLGLMLLMAAAGTLLSGCGSKSPGQNAVYTPPGNYTYTVSATDGHLTHTASYSLTVTVR